MTGKWVPLDLPWYDTRIFNCSFCGIMMARETWSDDEFPDDRFCNEDCAGVKRRLLAERREAMQANGAGGASNV